MRQFNYAYLSISPIHLTFWCYLKPCASWAAFATPYTTTSLCSLELRSRPVYHSASHRTYLPAGSPAFQFIFSNKSDLFELLYVLVVYTSNFYCPLGQVSRSVIPMTVLTVMPQTRPNPVSDNFSVVTPSGALRSLAASMQSWSFLLQYSA